MIQQFHFWVYIQKSWKKGPEQIFIHSFIWLFKHVHSNIIHSSQKTTQMSTDGWMDKQHMVYTHNRILSSLKKEGNSDTCFNMDETWKHYAKWNKPDTKEQIFYDSTYMRYLDQKVPLVFK